MSAKQKDYEQWISSCSKGPADYEKELKLFVKQYCKTDDISSVPSEIQILNNKLNRLSELEKKIKEEGTLVTKEYVKGRGNLYCNPAVSEYNRTTDSANKTVSTLIKIIKGFKGEDNSSDVDPLLAIINGGDEDEE